MNQQVSIQFLKCILNADQRRAETVTDLELIAHLWQCYIVNFISVFFANSYDGYDNAFVFSGTNEAGAFEL